MNNNKNSNQKSITFKQVDIIDNNGFNIPMTAISLLIPSDWQSQGQVYWNPMSESVIDSMKISWQGISSDGTRGASIIPTEAWQFNNAGIPVSPNLLAAPITNVREYIEYFIQRYRTNAEILRYNNCPDLTADMQYLNGITPVINGEIRQWVEGGEALISYNNRGHIFEEIITLVAQFQILENPGFFPGMKTQFLSGNTTNFVFAMAAPQGKLNIQLAEDIRKSIQYDPQWDAAANARLGHETSQKIAQNNKIAEIHRQGLMERGRIMQETQNTINNIHKNIWQNQQEANDRNHDRFMDVIREVETYYDPNKGINVKLPDTHKYYWKLDNGDYVGTNDANFNPYSVYGMGGEQLRRVR